MLNRMQQVGFDRAKKWWLDGNEQIFKIAGYAGTGKTYLSSMVSAELAENKIAFCAYTGKAALVMQQRGMPATTIHRLIYETIPEETRCEDDNGKVFYRVKYKTKLKEYLDPKPSIIMVDEASMIDAKILTDLLSFDIPIIAVGDPFQLPPVQGKESELLINPDVTLEEIMRQDEGSPIAYLAEKIRKGKPLKDDESYLDCIWQMSKTDLFSNLEIFNWAGQFIAARNATVNSINHQARQYFGFTGDLPVIGDKMICRRNSWDTLLVDGRLPTALVNGLIGYVTLVEEKQVISKLPWKPDGFMFSSNQLNLRPIFEETAEFTELKYNPLALWENDQQRRNALKGIILQYGYCITCHASQGSEWDNVVLYDDSWPDRNDLTQQARWRYTGVTRAAKKLIWLR
jgi:exodeoxyribonuclease-5